MRLEAHKKMLKSTEGEKIEQELMSNYKLRRPSSQNFLDISNYSRLGRNHGLRYVELKPLLDGNNRNDRY